MQAIFKIVDASTVTGEIHGGLGAMLCQTDEEGDKRVIAYASKQLLKHEKYRNPLLVEMQAMVLLWIIWTLT